MITLIRSKIVGNNSYLVWAFVIFVIVSLGAPSFVKQSSSSGPWIASVNTQEIGYNEFVRMVTWQEKASRQKNGASSVTSQQVYEQSLDALIYRALLDQAAQQAGITVSECYSAKRMSDLRFMLPLLLEVNALDAFTLSGGIDMRALRASLQSKGLTIQDFQELMGKAIARELLQQAAFVAGYSPKFEQRNNYKNTYLGKTFTLLTFPLIPYKEQAKNELTNNKKAIQDFFAVHAKQYTRPEKRSAIVWEFNPGSFGESVTKEQVAQYYERHKDTQFVQAPVQLRVRRILLESKAPDAWKKAKELQAELKAQPKLFEERARTLSKDTASASKGGLLDPFARGIHDKAFDKAAFLLPQAGAVSEVIETKDGLEILQLVERVNKVYKPLQSVSQDIHAMLEQKRFADLFESSSRPVLRKQDSKALAAFVEQHQGKATPYTDVVRDQDTLTQRIFSLRTGEAVSYFDKNKGYILQVTEVVPSTVPQLASIEGQVLADLIQEKAHSKLLSALQDALQQAKKIDMLAVAQTFKATTSRIENVKKNDIKTISSYQDKGVPLSKMLLLEIPGSLLVVQEGNNGYLVRLDSVEKMDEKDFQEKILVERNTLQQERMQTTLVGFIASMRRNATIKQRDTLLNVTGS